MLGDGMGGVEEEVIVTKPIGGKATIQLITNGKRAGSDALPPVPSAANFPLKDPSTSNDGLGGSQRPLSRAVPQAEAALNPTGKSTSMALPVKSDDGLGAITTPDSLKGTNAEPVSKGLPPKEKGDGVGGSGKKLAKAVVPVPEEKFMAHVEGNDGLGAQQRFNEAVAADAKARGAELQGTQLALRARDTSDGLGGFRRVSAAAASASSSASAAAAAGGSASGK